MQVTLPKQIEEKRAEMMAGLERLTLDKGKRNSQATYEEDTTPGRSKPTNRFQVFGSDSSKDSDNEEDDEEGPDPVKKYDYTESEGSSKKPIKLTKHQPQRNPGLVSP